MLKLGVVYKTIFEDVEPFVWILKNRQTKRYEVWVFCKYKDSSHNGWSVAFDGSLGDCRAYASRYGACEGREAV